MNRTATLLLVAVTTSGCLHHAAAPIGGGFASSASPSNRVVPVSRVKWQQLNPARGAMSPQAGTLWGDRHGEVATGFLAKFVDGFSSPPHIHNVTYRAVVIAGAIHNDDPDAEKMWMTKGAFWTQPKGEAHITSASGKANVALVEIDRGPYLVRPVADAFDGGERPVNLDASNVVWIDPPSVEATAAGIKVAYLYGDFGGDALNSSFIKLPAGFAGTVLNSGAVFHAVVIDGHVDYRAATDSRLEPGGYFGAAEASIHRIATSSSGPSILYIRTNGKYEISASR